jgi:type II secretory pathway pseudopilin PulG
MLLPVLARVKLKAKITAARADMGNISSAISAYQTAYTLAPTPKPLPGGGSGVPSLGSDFSFSETNSDIIVILMDIDALANAGHARNPQKHSLLNANMKPNTTGQGVSSVDYNFRDPWGNPYIIAFDLDYDNGVEVLNNPAGQNTVYEPYPYGRIPRSVLVWSLGPDGKGAPLADPQGYNKDNIKSWE